MSAHTTATARALEAIGRLLAQPGRQALTRAGFFGARYESYLDDMGTERIGEGPLDHLPWEGALHRLEQSAHAAGLLSGAGCPASG